MHLKINTITVMLFVLNIYPHIYKINLLHNYSHFVNCFSFTLLCTHFFFLSHGVPILMTSLYMYLPPSRCLHLFLNKVPAPFPLNWEGDLSSFPNNIYRYAPSRLLFFRAYVCVQIYVQFYVLRVIYMSPIHGE